MLDTREVRQALAAILPDLLNVFAGNRRIKKLVMRMVGKYLNRSLTRPEDVFERAELAPLFDDPQFIRHLAAPLPDLAGGLFDLIATGIKGIEHLNADDKKEIFSDLISKLSTGRTGDMITAACRILNDIHKTDPEFFAKRLEPGFKHWIESIDFGELKEMVDNSGADGRAFVEMVNNVMWQYPAKVVLLLSLIPSFINGLIVSADISLGRLNELPPDLLTDVVLSFIREVDPAPAASMVNQLTEIVRKVHTGSALLGDPGSPQLPRVLGQTIDQIMDQIDPEILWKAKIALAETRAGISQATMEAVGRNPKFRHLNRVMAPELFNIRLKSINQRLAALESELEENFDAANDTDGDTQTTPSLAKGLAAYDVQEMGEVLNNALRIVNRLADDQPDVLPELAAEIVNAIDDYELAETARHLFNGVGQEFKHLARAVVPGLITWVCDVLQPADDEYETDAETARNSLRDLLMKEEA